MTFRHSTIAVALLLVLAACGDGSSSTSSQAPPTTEATTTTTTTTSGSMGTTTTAPLDDTPLRGFSLSPAEYTEQGFRDFFETAAPQVDFISSVTDILEWEGQPGTATAVVGSVAPEYGFLPISITGVSHTENGELIRPIDDATFDRYVAAARSYAETNQPRFLGLGVEIDTQARTNPDDFEVFVRLFAEVAQAVHEVSPGTLVLTAFQLERLSGMGGGIFGGVNDPDQAQWELIDRFPDADIIAFTTYPGLVFTDPADIPDDYYTRLADYTGGRPIAFTEMGWQAGGDLAEWSGTEEKQAAFISRFVDLIAEADVAFYTWSWLYDQQTFAPFDTMGLIARDGTERPAWEWWKASG